MKLYNAVITKKLSFGFANSVASMNRENKYFTREGWEGIHFYNVKGEFCILTKEEELLVDVPKKFIKGQEQKDWMFVEPTKHALDLIRELSWGVYNEKR